MSGEQERAIELLEELACGVFRADASGVVRYANPAFGRILGRNLADILGQWLWDLYGPADAQQMRQALGELIEGRASVLRHVGRPAAAVSDSQGPTSPRWLQVKARLGRREAGEASLFGTLADVTEWRDAEDSLRSKQDLGQHLLRWSRELHQVWTFDELLKSVRDEVERRLGYTQAWLFLVPHGSYESLRMVAISGSKAEQVLGALPHLEPVQDEFLREVFRAETPLVAEDARTDPRTDKRIVARLGLRTLINLPLVLVDERLGGMGLGTFEPEAPRPPTKEELEYLIAMSRQVSVAAGRICLLEERRAAADERQALEAQIRHAQKLESLGVLAGGIAHDFNNLMASILSNTELAVESLPRSAQERDWLLEVINATQRAAKLSSQMLAYSGKGSFAVKRIDMVRLVNEITPLAQALGQHADVAIEAPPSPLVVEGDSAQLQQLVMNLLTNAAEAVHERAGTIQVSLRRSVADRAVLDHSYLNAVEPALVHEGGAMIELEVSDDGVGMDTVTFGKLFDPFFTTKQHGRGLGMASVLGTVRGHHGAIAVESQPGEGTRFRIWLPEARDSDEESTERPSRRPRSAPAEGLILVVDDEALVRRVICRSLEHLGYTTLGAPDGVQALELVQEHGTQLRAIVLDLTMPRLHGADVLRQLRETHASLPVLLTSGWSDTDPRAEPLLKDPHVGFLKKPFGPAELQQQLRAMGI